jgi:hypothetical protein
VGLPFGIYVKTYLGIVCLPFVECDSCNHSNPYFRILLFTFKTFSSSWILIFLNQPFLIQSATLLKNVISAVSIFASCVFCYSTNFWICMSVWTAIAL